MRRLAGSSGVGNAPGITRRCTGWAFRYECPFDGLAGLFVRLAMNADAVASVLVDAIPLLVIPDAAPQLPALTDVQKRMTA